MRSEWSSMSGMAAPLHPKRVFQITHDPIISEDGLRLRQLMNWNDPDELADLFMRDLASCSHGNARYEIVERRQVGDFPEKVDGYAYTPKSFMKALHAGFGFHQPDGIDYSRLIEFFGLDRKVEEGLIDEVWLFGFPFAGYFESIMAGSGAFWCNAPPLGDIARVRRRFIIMGFNYERGVGEMLESYGHRAESIMSHLYSTRGTKENSWECFIRTDKTHAGQSEVGTIHYAPNSERDYDWGNSRFVMSRCDDWFNYPIFKGAAKRVNCFEWGSGDMRQHHLWWFEHFPHFEGELDGIANNWWSYVLDPNLI